MTRTEWLTSDNPAAMLQWLTSDAAPRKPSARQLRLFACACCRAVWDRLTDPRSRRAVEVAERFADGLATGEQVRSAEYYANHVIDPDRHGWGYLVWASLTCCRRRDCGATEIAVTADAAEKLTQAAILRTIIGDPLRPVFVMQTKAVDWCRANGHIAYEWLTPDVLAIATRIYDTRDWDAMPMLADALQEAGCEDVRALEWLRGVVKCTDPDCVDGRWGEFHCETCNGDGRARCRECSGEGGYQWGSEDGGSPWMTCKPCSGTGRIKPVRCRGDWSLDMILGRE